MILYGAFHKWGYPQKSQNHGFLWKIHENPVKMDDHHKYIYTYTHTFWANGNDLTVLPHYNHG